MLEKIAGLPSDAMGLSAVGTVTGEDYEQTLIPSLKEKMAAHGKVRMLLHFGPSFTGYSASGMWEDTKLGLAIRGDLSKLAVVSDVV